MNQNDCTIRKTIKKLRIDGVAGEPFFKNAVAAMGKAFDVAKEKRPFKNVDCG